MSISQNIQRFQQKLPEGCRLIAVSKTKPIEALQEAYDAGCATSAKTRCKR